MSLKIETALENQSKIIIFGFESQERFSIPNAQFFYTSDENVAISLVSDPLLSVIVVHGNEPKSFEVLERYEQESSKVTRILVGQTMTLELIKKAVNQGHVHEVIDELDFKANSVSILNRALERFQIASSRAQLFKESTRQFRELEALNSSLENIVLERTQHIEISKNEEDEKLNRVRSLIRLIKDLAQVSSFEELLVLLRREFRRFHKTGEPILVYQTISDRIEFVSLQAGQVQFTHRKGLFPFPSEIQVLSTHQSTHQSTELIQILANHFGRPFVRTLYIPLEPKLMKEHSFQGAQAGVCLEMSFSELELDRFLDFLKERLQSVAITVDRLLLENELLQFSYRWEKTFDGFRDPIAIVDFEYEVLRANRKFSDKLSQKKCYENFAGRTEVCDGCPIVKAMETGISQSGEIRVGERGNEKIFEVHSYPIVLDKGVETTNVVNQYVDVTQSRELYLRMVQSEKMGAIGLLAGNIAHELNNPLTGLRSLAQVLIQQCAGNESLKSDLQEIESAAGRSQQIIRNLLEFSVGAPQKSRKISMDEIVMKTMPMLKTVMRIHRQELDLHGENAQIQVEPHLIQQVVFNLVNNACQSMKDPGVLTLKTFSDQGKVCLEIGDTGSGIPVALREKIFEPFFTTKSEGLGTGLGLSLAKKIVESFGGEIVFRTDLKQGSVFRISFPEVI